MLDEVWNKCQASGKHIVHKIVVAGNFPILKKCLPAVWSKDNLHVDMIKQIVQTSTFDNHVGTVSALVNIHHNASS